LDDSELFDNNEDLLITNELKALLSFKEV